MTWINSLVSGLLFVRAAGVGPETGPELSEFGERVRITEGFSKVKHRLDLGYDQLRLRF